MISQAKKAYLTFGISCIVITLLLILLPVNLFDGEIVYKVGTMEHIEQRPMSLRFLTGMEGDLSKLPNVKSVNLSSKGYLMLFIILVGFPALLSYRVFLGKKEVK